MKWLRHVADGATVVVALAVLFVLAMRFSGDSSQPSPDLSDAGWDGSFTGVRLDAPAGMDLSAAERTLVAVLRSDCPFCDQSKPFYEQLARRDRTGIQIVVAAPRGDTGIENYRSVLEPDSIVFVGPGALPVRGTPTLLLVDSEGAVEAAWTGLLGPEREAEVLAAVFGAR